MENKIQAFDAEQIERIIDKIVPMVAKEEDYEFFRGVLFCKAEACKTSGEFTLFVKNLLELRYNS